MQAVTVNKVELRKRIQANRDRHHAMFEEALERFWNACIQQLEDRVQRIHRRQKIEMVIRLPEPEDHSDDYDRVLAMLDMHQDDLVEISEHDFAMYVMDQWHWKGTWIDTTASYLTE